MSKSGLCVDESLVSQAQDVVELLRQRKLTVITAESCTGGLIAALLSHAPGASDCLHGGFVVYTKQQKTNALGVSNELLALRGSVNAEVARQLADGALKRSPADLAVAVTGVLGPTPDEDGNQPGNIYFGLARRGRETQLFHQDCSGQDPDRLRRAVVTRVLELLREAALAS